MAAVPRVRAAAAPAVTRPASAPVSRAICREAAACSSSSPTHSAEAARNASSTAAGIGAPPSRVTEPEALMIGTSPQRSKMLMGRSLPGPLAGPLDDAAVGVLDLVVGGHGDEGALEHPHQR